MLHSNAKRRVFFGYSPILHLLLSIGENIGRVTALRHSDDVSHDRASTGIHGTLSGSQMISGKNTKYGGCRLER